MKVDVYGLDGSVKENINVNGALDNVKVSKKSVYYKIINENFNSHLGTATNKGRSDVRGGGKKPWRQKHTGRARHGSRRSPIWRGGGVVFGGQTKNYKFKLPDKLKKQAVLSLVKLKLESGQMKVIDSLEVSAPKTKALVSAVKGVAGNLDKKVIFIVDKNTDELIKASRNVKNLLIMNVNRLTLRFLADNDNIFITKDALNNFVGEKK